MAMSAPPQLDFEALLSREYRPARVTRLQPRESFHPPSDQQQQQQQQQQQKKKSGSVVDDSTAAAGQLLQEQRTSSSSSSSGVMIVRSANDIANSSGNSNGNGALAAYTMTPLDLARQEETRKLVLSLVTQTPDFLMHLTEEERQRVLLQRNDIVQKMFPPPPKAAVASSSHIMMHTSLQQHRQRPFFVDPQFSEVKLGDWESKIDWGGDDDDDEDDADDDEEEEEDEEEEYDHGDEEEEEDDESSETTERMTTMTDPRLLLQCPRNPFLDNLVFDETTVCWDGDADDLAARAARAPLILELGIAGRSVAKKLYQNTVLSAQRPMPATRHLAYEARMDRDWCNSDEYAAAFMADGGGSGTFSGNMADISRGTLHHDKEKMEALIQARQMRRAQMAMDKTNRVSAALGTLALGGGRGRAVTSSLMGPGGTERTGRPSRHVGGINSEAEVLEQLDMLQNHSLVRDLSKVLLRQYHRPKLPLSVVRQDLSWQLQIRYTPAAKKQESSNVSSFMMSQHAGAISKAKLRTEADLSPSEGMLVIFEYVEERPPVQLVKGMHCKIINYYRGDKARCPVSAGGGDQPARRKRAGEAQAGGGGRGQGASSVAPKNDRLLRLEGPNRETSVMDWVGELPKKSKKETTEKEDIDILPEGVTEILHPKVHGPFIGEVQEGMTLTGLVSNLFVAPMFRHEPEPTDFLMILTPLSGAARPGQREAMGVILRDFPSSLYTVGQTEPRVRVNAPNTPGEKAFVGPYVSYQIARALTRSQTRDGHGLRFDELQDRVLPNMELPANALRQRLKQVAVHDKNAQIWTTKSIGFEDYPGVEALGRTISPESIATFETTSSASRRLSDLGIHHLYSGTNTAASVGVVMLYLAGQLNAARELSRKTKKLVELSKTNKSIQPVQAVFYERAASELESFFKMLRQKHEVAQFIYEELQLAPWHLTGEFIDVHKKGEGTAMMKLTGLGDPSGKGEGFSFLREADAKPSKSVGNTALNDQVKKITGTEDDLRKLTMKQMAALLRSYGMADKQINTLKRWDRVHVIRDLSTKAASDGIGDGLERFARGEKMKLSEQKQMYRDRIGMIWKRQIAALAADAGDKGVGGDGGDGGAGEENGAGVAQTAQQKKSATADNDDSDSESDDDDLAAALEEEMMDRTDANQLVAEHAQTNKSVGGLGQLRAATQDQDLNRDARELAALQRQRHQERQAQEGLQKSRIQGAFDLSSLPVSNRKVIRKRITKTHPDGRQVTTFKFILQPGEVGKIMARLQQQGDGDRQRKEEMRYDYGQDEKPPGHAMFEDEDDFEYSSKGKMSNAKRRAGGRRAAGGRATPRQRAPLQIGKLKKMVSKEERMQKRKREEEELEVYTAQAKRKSTNNRRERGSIRERRPHVIFAEKLEAIRAAMEARPFAQPFMKPVNSRLIPRYYEVISNPIDLQTIRDKISRYEYRRADALVKDFELMKSNAIKFNGEASTIAQEAIAIADSVKHHVESSREELSMLEEAVEDQMSTKPKKKKKKQGSAKKSTTGTTANIKGVEINLGDVPQNFDDDSDSGFEDEMFTGLQDVM